MTDEKIVNDIMEIKKTYTAPGIELIILDNEISLALASDAPVGPGESVNNIAPEFFNNDPWKINVT